MDILMRHSFFKVLDGSYDSSNIRGAYSYFLREVFEFYSKAPGAFIRLVFTLNYTYIELASLSELYRQHGVEKKEEKLLYLHKDVSFISEAIDFVKLRPVRLTKADLREKRREGRQWTGSIIEFVEMIYGLHEVYRRWGTFYSGAGLGTWTKSGNG